MGVGEPTPSSPRYKQTSEISRREAGSGARRAEDGAKLAVVFFEQGVGFVRREIAELHDERGFDAAFGLVEEREGGGAVEVGLRGEDAGGPVAEFGVGGAEVDHEVAPGFAALDHDSGGDHVEGELGDGAGFHAGGAGDDFRAGDEFDEVIDVRSFGEMDAADEGGGGVFLFREFERAPDVGGCAAGHDADEGVVCDEVDFVECVV